jgi:hypothetical protein
MSIATTGVQILLAETIPAVTVDVNCGLNRKTHLPTSTASELAKAVYGNFHLHQFLIKQYPSLNQFNEFCLVCFFII